MANLEVTVGENEITVEVKTSGFVGVNFKRNKFNTNGILTTFALTYTPISDSLTVFYNGILQELGVDFTLSAKNLVFGAAPATGKIEANYAYTS